MPERLVTDINHDWICRSTSHFYPDCPRMSSDSRQTNHQHSSTIKNTSKLGRPHNLSCAVTRNFPFLICRSVWQYEHSQKLEFIITVPHFCFRGSSMCYTCIITFTVDLVGSSNPVQQSSLAIQSTIQSKIQSTN